uniref:Uncharacterized protein n=1 Tax=Tanacetum cinerariifolium TaxID=118510 RepID=A0A6L2KYG4_TANCI|nr:hypothetical protein [Tanacetum cinerariifolium]
MGLADDELSVGNNHARNGPIAIFDTEPVTSLVPTKIKTNDNESKINELTKLVQMLMDEKINSTQKIQELKSVSSQPESSKPVNSFKQSQDFKPNGKSPDSSKPDPLQYECKKEDHKTLDHETYIASMKSSQNYKAQPYQYASPSKQILESKAKPYPPYTHCSFNDHHPDDCRNYPKCKIYGSYYHFTSGHNRAIQVRGGVLAESSQSNESSIRVSCTTCGSNVHSTTDYNDFKHFKRVEKI